MQITVTVLLKISETFNDRLEFIRSALATLLTSQNGAIESARGLCSNSTPGFLVRGQFSHYIL